MSHRGQGLKLRFGAAAAASLLLLLFAGHPPAFLPQSLGPRTDRRSNRLNGSDLQAVAPSFRPSAAGHDEMALAAMSVALLGSLAASIAARSLRKQAKTVPRRGLVVALAMPPAMTRSTPSTPPMRTERMEARPTLAAPILPRPSDIRFCAASGVPAVSEASPSPAVFANGIQEAELGPQRKQRKQQQHRRAAERAQHRRMGSRLRLQSVAEAFAATSAFNAFDASMLREKIQRGLRTTALSRTKGREARLCTTAGRALARAAHFIKEGEECLRRTTSRITNDEK